MVCWLLLLGNSAVLRAGVAGILHVALREWNPVRGGPTSGIIKDPVTFPRFSPHPALFHLLEPFNIIYWDQIHDTDSQWLLRRRNRRRRPSRHPRLDRRLTPRSTMSSSSKLTT